MPTISAPLHPADASRSVTIGPGASVPSASMSVVGPPGAPPRNRRPPSHWTTAWRRWSSVMRSSPSRREAEGRTGGKAERRTGDQLTRTHVPPFRPSALPPSTSFSDPPLLPRRHPLVVPDRVERHRGRGPGERTQQQGAGTECEQGEE